MAGSDRAVTVTTTATRLDTPEPSGEAAISVYNAGAATVYIGTSAATTTATGTPLPPGLSWAANGLDSTETIYAIVATGTCEVRVMELGI